MLEQGKFLEEGSNGFKQMKPAIKSLLILFIFTFSLLSQVGGNPIYAETSTPDVLEKIVENHRELSQGLSVPYQREILSRSMALLGDEVKSDIASGIFYFKRPHFLKVHQEQPGEEFIIFNNQYMWWSIPGKKVVYKYSGEQLGKELTVLCDIFMGLKDPDQNFNIKITGLTDSGEYVVNLTPSAGWEEIEHIDITVSGENFRIKKIELYNIIGSITRFILGEFKARSDLSEDGFYFTPPEGVEVILE